MHKGRREIAFALMDVGVMTSEDRTPRLIAVRQRAEFSPGISGSGFAEDPRNGIALRSHGALINY